MEEVDAVSESDAIAALNSADTFDVDCALDVFDAVDTDITDDVDDADVAVLRCCGDAGDALDACNANDVLSTS